MAKTSKAQGDADETSAQWSVLRIVLVIASAALTVVCLGLLDFLRLENAGKAERYRGADHSVHRTRRARGSGRAVEGNWICSN